LTLAGFDSLCPHVDSGLTGVAASQRKTELDDKGGQSEKTIGIIGPVSFLICKRCIGAK
jgi:hypothetical protein